MNSAGTFDSQSRPSQTATSQRYKSSQREQPKNRFRSGLASLKGHLWAASMKILPLSLKETDILIGVMGMTGAGKTSFIKEITGLDMEVGHTLEACKFSPTSLKQGVERKTS